MSTGNAALMARNAVTDGIAMRWPYEDEASHHTRYLAIVAMYVAESGSDEMQVRKQVKYERIKSGRHNGGYLSALFVGGSLVKYTNREWLEENIEHLTEVQVKFYLIEQKEGSYEAFIEATWAGRGGKFKPAWYGTTGTGRQGKSQSRAFTLGTDKSDLHVTANKYRGERPGIEGHVKGEVLRKAKRAVVEREQREADNGTARKAFPEVKYQASLRTARRFLSAVRSRGIVLTDYFKGVSYISWERPLHERGFDVLDPEEERLQAALGDIEGVYPDSERQADFLDEQ